MAETANERLRNATISHEVDLALYGNNVVYKVVALLNRVDADLFAQLNEALLRLPPDSFTVQRLDLLLKSVRDINAHAYALVNNLLGHELTSFAVYEAAFQQQLFASVLPAVVEFQAVDVQQAYAAALSQPFQGKLLKEWSSSLEEGRMTRIRDTLRMGFVESKTIQQMVTDLRGTRAANYSDGLLEIDRRSAEAVVRTATSHVAGHMREATMDANPDLVQAVTWVSTLDTRTTPLCRVRDGLQYSIDHKPIGHKVPWLSGPGRLHWQCRSSSAPVLVSFRDLGIPLDEFDEGTRASMDGQVPAETTYNEWLKKQSAARQDDVLGPTRGQLLRKGELEIDKFYNDKGKFLTLDELRLRDAAAFKRAGL